MISIVDYGVGNLGSILNMCNYLGIRASIVSDAGDIQKADKLLLPGVGAFDAGMQHLIDSGLTDVLNEQALERKKPVLGICLGMQLMTQGSEEGNLPGLAWFNARTLKFSFSQDAGMRIPHMGWNNIEINHSHSLLEGLDTDSRFYFVHSYYVKVEDKQQQIAATHYGDIFTSIIAKDNIMGCQFHPEKSHRFGMQILKNFSKF